MPRRKSKEQISKEKELEIKKQLDDILLADEMLEGLSAPDIPPIKAIRMMNFDSTRLEVESEAKKLLGSLLKFYLDDNLIKEDDFSAYKARIDVLNISTMAFTIRSAMHGITKLMDEIDAGGSQYMARNYEVLSQLQAQLFAMPEKFQKYIIEMEKGYKAHAKEQKEREAKSDAVVLNPSGEEANVSGLFTGGGVKVRGNKSLMENIQSSLKNGVEYKKGEIVEEEKELIDPRSKDLLTPNEFLNKKDEEPGFSMDQDLF